MMKKIIAIGGGENGRLLENGHFTEYETEPIDKEIIRLTEKQKPNFLFIVHSQAQSMEIEEAYYQTMKKIYGEKFGCNCQDLKSTELQNIEIVKEKIKWADIIYEGGGDTITMLNLWRKTGFDKVLWDAWNSGKVICGISAGAVCWFRACSSESLTVEESKQYLDDIECLNWFNAYFTPHGDEKDRYEITKEQLRQNNLTGILLSNCAAIEILDDKYRLITSKPTTYKFDKPYGLKTYWINNRYIEENIIESNEFKNLNELLLKQNKYERD